MSRAKTILVVDDSLDDVQLLKTMFKRSRILNPVQAVEGVADAVCYLKGEGVYSDRELYPFPALVFIDLHLRDGSGFDILRWLHVHKPSAPVAAVVLSGSDVGAFRRAYELGAHSFLVKPLKFEEFRNMVDHVRGIKLMETAAGRLLDLE
ncbi:MAG TPA: response regulator [Verrucomicrobiae bacterium]|nr:response regulator [Verrucomicrobiae bacterium]